MDVARVFRTTTGWRLAGTAVFLHETNRAPSHLEYALDLHRDWSTKRALIQGFVGRRSIRQAFTRDAGGWTINGQRVSGRGAAALREVVDLDLGFTPATNFAQVKRIGLSVGASANFAVAWWDVGKSTLTALPQQYERRSKDRYWYESPESGYEAGLQFERNGFVRRYPGLWEAAAED
jgi:uncharacterized protein